ncbi:hypothetical protein [Clostridium tagluense]|uniref:hypothetical protein n=1 Tax=Clostridium tagluense TaxID=360422 RepID=UPI001CF4AD98|nr:hypothetical protein [Clostridium tagluense]MCB2297863.1 hypothetical protein [Clostridium tagluense]
MKGRHIGKREYGKFKDGLYGSVKIQGVDSKFVNIPTIVTGLNEDGTINQEEIDPYAYEIVEQNKGVTD